ncbi:hypothetical protein BDW72DRAFT_208851 [Aspergillus terricola var. indicus]
MKAYCILSFIAAAAASITISNPAEIIPESQWASDNAIMDDYNVSTEAVQRIAQVGPYMVRGQQKRFHHTTLKVDRNDTSVLLLRGESAVLVANNSLLHLSDVNITTHNGAANLYAYGTGSIAYIDNVWLYSSGPTAHGLYAAGNGTIYAKNVHHFSDSVAHTTGIGSAIAFVVKHVNLTNQTQAYPFQFTLDHTRLKVLGDAPGLWYGAVYADSYICNSQIITEPGVLAVANFSTITEASNFYSDYATSGDIVATADSRDLVAYNGSTLGFSFEKTRIGAELAVSLDKTSSWNLTGNTALKDFTNADMSFSNVKSNGFSITYDPDAPANKP